MPPPLLLTSRHRLLPTMRATAFDGLSSLIDVVAEAAPVGHRFLRYHWYASALLAYGGRARTIVVEDDGEAIAALPFIRFGPEPAALATVPGCYWPFRCFPARQGINERGHVALLDGLAREVNALRIGPSYDGDAIVTPFVAAARARGWAVLDRFVADSYLLDLAAVRAGGAWPRPSTIKKNRFHEKHLASHGALDWRFLEGAALAAGGFDQMAAVEEKSWIATSTDGRDAKFTRGGHGTFWRSLTGDPVLAAMLRTAMLAVGDAPAAFSFDMDVGPFSYAIANSYDPAFAKHSPGKLLYYRNLMRAIDRGIQTVDWGAGDSGYKRVIGARKGPAIRDLLLLRPGMPAILGQALRALWRRSGNPDIRADPQGEGSSESSSASDTINPASPAPASMASINNL
ncbi:GNAT family N-acetyltransferase [uncultured Sphingomonas sp.]|uniref:GNAT family N-acetyltransferase n=1 Tax=uncultured Sphingomonas sp. TaxID=158754 RepID=UPI0035CA21FD